MLDLYKLSDRIGIAGIIGLLLGVFFWYQESQSKANLFLVVGGVFFLASVLIELISIKKELGR